MKKSKYIGRKVFIKFGTFHAHAGVIIDEVHHNGSDRFLVKLENGKTIMKKQRNVMLMGRGLVD